MLITDPPRACSAGHAALVRLNTMLTSPSSVWAKASLVSSPIHAKCASAALLNSTSIVPKLSSANATSAAQAAGSRYESAINLFADGKSDDGTKALADIAKDGPPGYAALAELRSASVYAGAGKSAEALASYEQLANSSNADPLLRDYARLQAASLRAGQADWTEMQNRLNPLIGDKSPWRYFARELLAVAALKAGKTAEARSTLESMVADPVVPASLAERARQMMSQVVAAEQAALPAPPPEPDAPAAASAAQPAQAPAQVPSAQGKPADTKAPSKGKR